MERFAKVAFCSKKSKLNILNVCRCCGLAGQEMYCISLTDIDDDFTLTQKIKDLLAIDVKDHDKMPPNICSLCMDKVTDFYEFRLMSLNTEKQTRIALGLPAYVNPNTQIKEVVKIVHVMEPAPKTALIPVLKKLNINSLIGKAGRSRKYEEDNPSSEDEVVPVSKRGKMKAASRTEVVVSPPPAKKSKKEIPCNICYNVNFSFHSDLNDHLIKEHSPNVVKYGCASCREQFSTQGQLKEHDQWHNKNKEPYICFQCNEAFVKATAFNKHMAPYKCIQAIQLPVSVEDIKCFQCKKKFLTENLFEWHGCYIKTKTTCPKCNKFYAKKPALFKHYVFCDAKNFGLKKNLQRGEEMGKNKKQRAIKQEKMATETSIQSITNMLSTVDSAIAKLQKKKKKQNATETSGNINTNIVKSEINFDEEERDENMEEEDINYDDYFNNGDDFQQGDEYNSNEEFADDGSDPSSPIPSTMEPLVNVQEGETPTIKIKQEKLDPAYGDKEVVIDPNVLRNIKKEPNLELRNVTLKKHQLMQKKKHQIALLLKIKQEGGVPGASTVSVINPLAVKKKPMDLKKKLFKIPANLMRNIKKEKMHPGYGDNDSIRDEAEADEDSNESYVEERIIKKEKMNESYGDDMDNNTSVMSNSSLLLNPMAVVRQKNLAAAKINGTPEDSQPMGLVISSVNSIFNIEETPEDTNQNEQSRNGSEMENDVPEAMMPTANKFKPIKIKQELHIANVQSRCEDSSDKEQSTEQFDYSSADRGTALQNACTMVEIPVEFQNSEEKSSQNPPTLDLVVDPITSQNSQIPEESEEALLEDPNEAVEALSSNAVALLLEESQDALETVAAPVELDIENILENLSSELTSQFREEDELMNIGSSLSNKFSDMNESKPEDNEEA